MDPFPVFVLQFVWLLLVWATLAAIFVTPRLRGADVDRALAVCLTPQLFRVLGAGLLVPRLAPDLPRAFALPTAIGDTATAALALVAIVALDRRARRARTLVWVCNVIGTCDVVVALAHAAHIGAARFLAAQWYVATVMVPLAIVSHVLVFRLLLGELTSSVAATRT